MVSWVRLSCPDLGSIALLIALGSVMGDAALDVVEQSLLGMVVANDAERQARTGKSICPSTLFAKIHPVVKVELI